MEDVCEHNIYEEHYVSEYKWKIKNFLEKKTRIRDAKKESYLVNSTKIRSHKGNYLWSLRIFCEKDENENNGYGYPTALNYGIEIQCNSLTNIFHEKKIEIKLDIDNYKIEYFKNYTLEDCVNSKENCKQIFLFNDLHVSSYVTNKNHLTVTFRSFEPFSPAINIPEMHTLSCDYEGLLKSGNNSDFKIIIGEKKFLVHKIILASRSEYFSLMFKYDSKEQADNQVEISDVRYEVMFELLRYIYCAKVNVEEDIAYDLLTAADMYQMNDLKKKCEQLIITNLKGNNVGQCMAYAERYNNPSLKLASATFLMKFASEFSEDDINLLKSNMTSISSPFMTSLVCALLFKNEQIMV